MQNNLKRALSQTSYTAEESLARDTWQAIVTYEKRTAHFKLWIFSIIGFISLAGLIPVCKILLSDFAQSGFYEYVSLAFSSGGSVVTYWKEFLMLLAESLPMISILSSLTLVFIFFLSLKYAMRQIIKNQLTLSF